MISPTLINPRIVMRLSDSGLPAWLKYVIAALLVILLLQTIINNSRR